MSPSPDQELVELVWENGKILLQTLSTFKRGKLVALTQVKNNNVSLINCPELHSSPRSSRCHHIQEEHAPEKAMGCGPEVHVLHGVCGKDCSSSTIKSINRDDTVSLASFHIKPNRILTSQAEFQAAQPNSRPSYAHDTPPDQQSNTVSHTNVLVSDNLCTFTGSTKQKLDTKASFEPPETTSSEYSPSVSVSNEMNTKRNCQQTGDLCHCNDDDQSDNVNALALLPGKKGMKRKRAAQVHKLSEKRRRDKINKRLRALQDLIPNCTKMDKASVLDEAIEYLKSLQLQLQIMATFSGFCVPPARMMVPACYPTINSAIASRLGMGAACSALQLFNSPFSGYGMRL